MSKYILTTTPILKKAMINAVRSSVHDFNITKELGNGVYLVIAEDNAGNTASELSEFYNARKFIKHLFKVDIVLSGSKSLADDLNLLKEYIDGQSFSPEDKFSVQVRNVNNESYTAKDIEVGLGLYTEEKHHSTPYFDDKRIPLDLGQKIVSVFIFGNEVYVGIGSVKENLYPISDPYRIFSRWNTHISRAEFKLREALQIINYTPEKGKLAVDLGAAPGGWSAVLAEAGMNVMAVDPAELDDRIYKIKNITHFKGRSENFHTKEEIDLLVNDMNLDPDASAKVVLSFSKNLKAKTLVIMTIKLVCGPYENKIDEVCKILSPEFNLLDIRLLFHNRQEVTAFFEKI